MMRGSGRPGALRALAGEAVSPTPAALFTWGFDYTWQVAGLAPWQLACGDAQTWHRAHMALLDRHAPDCIFYEGSGPAALPRLLSETRDQWVIEDGTGKIHGLRTDSLALYDLETGVRNCDAVGSITTTADADRLVEEFTGSE